MTAAEGKARPRSDEATMSLDRGVPSTPLGALLRVSGVAAPPPPHRLSVGRCLVGSAQSCDLVIDAPTVSRRHLELSLVPEGVALQDLGSRNGTFYLGQRVEKMVLALGAQLKLGDVTLAVDADTDGLSEAPVDPDESYRGMVGRSLSMRRIFAMLKRLSGSLARVLVQGESGVGKELVARALHDGSPVAGGAFVALNCGAIATDLVASELFGHRRGAFTGAIESRKGAFEAADGGTLFLDEIGELPLDVQPMLLRALESGEVRALGEDQPQSVKVRLVAATNRDLEELVAAGAFRQDLYYRIAVVTLHVPPLRERPDDLEPLAARFAQAAGLANLPREVIEQLRGRSFPGNVRELRNAVEAYAALGVLPQPSRSKAATLDLALKEAVDLDRPYAELKERLLDRFTRHYLEALLERTNGNQTAAARIAGLDRSYLGNLVVKHGIAKK